MSIGNITDCSSILQNYQIPVVPQSAPGVITEAKQQENIVSNPVVDIREETSGLAPARQCWRSSDEQRQIERILTDNKRMFSVRASSLL